MVFSEHVEKQDNESLQINTSILTHKVTGNASHEHNIVEYTAIVGMKDGKHRTY